MNVKLIDALIIYLHQSHNEILFVKIRTLLLGSLYKIIGTVLYGRGKGGGFSQGLATVSSFALYFKASLSNFGHICDCEQSSIIFVVKAFQILKLYVLFDLACINDSYPHRYIYLLNLIPFD